jgi:hypothetical protein
VSFHAFIDFFSVKMSDIFVFYSFFSMSDQVVVEWGTSKPADSPFDAMERTAKGMAKAGEQAVDRKKPHPK